MKTLFEKFQSSISGARMIEFVEHNSRKFKIYVEISNGDPLGFNHKCCLSVMSADGDFKEVVDNRQIDAFYRNDYHAPHIRKLEIMKASINDFKAFIKQLY